MSLWNLLMVCQRRSDWPKERKWASKELQKLCGESGNLEGIHRGLLIDWGFGILERSTVATPFQPLTDEDVNVYRPAEPSPRPPFDGLDEGDNMRHCISPPSSAQLNTYSVPPLWQVTKDGQLAGLNTQTFVRAIKDGQVEAEWVNEALRREKSHLSNATVRLSVDALKASS
jgi:hypothetical protein